jgi:hypothetical protein
MVVKIKATGEIVDVYESCNEDFPWTDEMGDEVWKTEELIFLETTNNTPDYWTKLEHQYAGMAMQTMLATLYNPKYHKEVMACYTEVDAEEVARLSKYYAHTLVKKMKEKEK